MYRKCFYCKHCKSVMERYEDTPPPFDSMLKFYCLKDGRCLGNMRKRKDKVEYLPCFERSENE